MASQPASSALRVRSPAPERCFWLGLAAFTAHLGWQIVRLDIRDPDVCLAVFKSDRDAGLILFCRDGGGCVVARVGRVWAR